MVLIISVKWYFYLFKDILIILMTSELKAEKLKSLLRAQEEEESIKEKPHVKEEDA